MKEEIPLENIIELVNAMTQMTDSKEPVKRKYETAFGKVATMSSLFQSIADMFDGLGKDVDIMEGELLYHENVSKQAYFASRKNKEKSLSRPISLYKRDISEIVGKITHTEAEAMWERESEETRNKYKNLARIEKNMS